ncbi:histone-lysine N-methyltransferase SETMAR [Plakobranchus ocellatus]|uniref:Histone-lysine N-methyltransferase SETMAR n=1 Tax=Plakobranchus ocellatus TaxID=259542 RepID=A0AAV3Y4N1_9GAST|nr:histone-lysine N-methyltransferase SETMAR [Plakobranchus ocellatus]
MKAHRKDMCIQLLERYNAEGEVFLQRILTGDESWVHRYDPECHACSVPHLTWTQDNCRPGSMMYDLPEPPMIGLFCGEHFGHNSGENFEHTNGEYFGHNSGEHFGHNSGEHFGHTNGEYFGHNSGEHFEYNSWEHFGTTMGNILGIAVGNILGITVGNNLGIQWGTFWFYPGVGGTVDSKSALRSAGTVLSRVRALPPALGPDGEPERLRSPCCGLAICENPN